MKPDARKPVFAWALYDWANSAYAVVVMTAIGPVVFKDAWAGGLEPVTASSYWGVANSIASLLVALLAPVLGAIADHGGARKKFLFFFTVLGVTMTAALFWVAQGQWLLALLFYVAATVGFSGGLTFYDALLPSVAGAKKLDTVSALGYALGYLGSGLLFAVCVAMAKWPAYFGLADAASAVQLAFILVAVWWAVFAVPLLLFVKEPPATGGRRAGMVRQGLRQLAQTFREIRQLRVVFLFLLAYWLYIDGVDTIVRMAAAYGKDLGFGNEVLIEAILLTQLVGFPAALAYGYLGQRWGAKTGILIAIGVYVGVVFWGYFMDSEREFYLLAITIGLVQGGVQSLSRSLYVRIIPANKTAEFFGFYNMLGKFAAVVGPALMAWVGAMTGNPRTAILSLLVLFIAGAWLLCRVDIAAGQRIARDMERVE